MKKRTIFDNEQQILINELYDRFPLCKEINGRFSAESEIERTPLYFSLFMAAALSNDPRPCCFVLDKTPGTVVITAVLLALENLKSNFEGLARDYASRALDRGQLVRVKPSNYVYKYDGVWEEYPHLFRLRVLNDESNSCSFPITDVLRLEPTKRVRPMGRGGTNLGQFERSWLDKLLDIDTCGNNSLFQNTVLVHMANVRFSRIMENISLGSERTSDFPRLSEVFAWGSIGGNGELIPDDPHQVSGEPIIAVTRNTADIERVIRPTPKNTKVIFVDGAAAVAKDLSIFDEIIDHQKVVILASPEEREDLKILNERDYPIWCMSPDAVLIGEEIIEKRLHSSNVGFTIRAAETKRSIKVRIESCHDKVLVEVASCLERAAKLIKSSYEEIPESEEILASLYRVLLECSERICGINEDLIDDVRATRDKLTKNKQWFGPKIIHELEAAANQLHNALQSGNFGNEKIDALLRIIHEENDELHIICTRSPQSTENIKIGLKGLIDRTLIMPVSAVNSDSECAGVVLPAWPNQRKFRRLINLTPTANIQLVLYPFESMWLNLYKKQEEKWSSAIRMDVVTLSSILGIDDCLLSGLVSNLSNPSIIFDPPAFVDEKVPPIIEITNRVSKHRSPQPRVPKSGDDSREAFLVDFFGGCYSLMTEWAELPRINQLIDSFEDKNLEPELVTAVDLNPQDFVLFRGSGDKEIIRLIAEDLLGQEKYNRFRTKAELWKESLRKLGNEPAEIQHRLKLNDLVRNIVTIRGWLYNPDRIGPGDLQDIEYIAMAAKDDELLVNLNDVKESITNIRSTHIKAGKELTRLLYDELFGRLNQLSDQPQRLDLGFGEAWIVNVRKVEQKPQLYPSSDINRLLWDYGFEFWET